MSRLLENLKAGDAVIVSGQTFGPDRIVRKIRSVDYVAKVYKNVLQTSSGLCGVDISTGRAVDAYGSVYVTPASLQDVADVLREIEDRKRADAEYKAQQEAEYADRRRREKLSIDIRDIVMYRHVPEGVLARALAVLRGDE
jgi:hypothetical protein